MQIKVADPHDGKDQHDADNNHEDIGVAWSGDEGRQIMRGAWMK
jgi:hypothetical protein